MYVEKPIDVKTFPAHVCARCWRARPRTCRCERPARILVVDDLPQNIKLLEAILAPRGYAVIEATSGEEALAAIAKERPDLVLLDVVMPGIDGYETCRRLRADPSPRVLPVIMVTASGDAAERCRPSTPAPTTSSRSR